VTEPALSTALTFQGQPKTGHPQTNKHHSQLVAQVPVGVHSFLPTTPVIITNITRSNKEPKTGTLNQSKVLPHSQVTAQAPLGVPSH
jgi:hypothetical protein